MAQTVLITLTTAGSDTGPFDLYSDVDGYVIPFENNVPKASLESGYTSVVVPDAATIIRVQSDNVTCDNYIDLTIVTTTTSTSSTSTTTTSTSSTSSTTTTTTTSNCLGVADNLAVTNNVGTICEEPCITLYTGGEVIAAGSLIYNDICLTSPTTGFNYIIDCDTLEFFEMNPLNGQVGTSLGFC